MSLDFILLLFEFSSLKKLLSVKLISSEYFSSSSNPASSKISFFTKIGALNLIDNAIASDVLESILITSSLFSQTIFEKNTPSLSLLIII